MPSFTIRVAVCAMVAVCATIVSPPTARAVTPAEQYPATPDTPAATEGNAAPPSTPGAAPRAGTGTRLDEKAVAQRLQRIMTPLLQSMDHPIPLDQVEVGVVDDPHINAANAGGGKFYVTMGLLQKANDEQMRAVLAHEMGHADLGHVAKLQRLGAGLNIGAALLGRILPGANALAPIAGRLVTDAYTRKEEYAADAQGVRILQRAGYNGKELMANTLTWLMQTEGASGGGFFATHPATGDRVQAVRRLPDAPARSSRR